MVLRPSLFNKTINMKHIKPLLSLVILILSGTYLQAQSNAEDHAAISTTLNYYLEGGTQNDFSTLSKAFHPNATMKSVGENGIRETNAVAFFKKGMKPGPAQNRKTRIISVDISGTAANARLEIEYDTFTFIDYMHLLKIDGEWKIVSKIFYKKDH